MKQEKELIPGATFYYETECYDNTCIEILTVNNDIVTFYFHACWNETVVDFEDDPEWESKVLNLITERCSVNELLTKISN